MLDKITEEELLTYEVLINPVCLIECLFSDLENTNLAAFDDRFSHVRLGQLVMLSYEYLIDEKNPALTTKENYQLRIGAGTIYNFGGRRYGKSLCTELLDLIIDMILYEGENIGFTSYDAMHIEGMLEPVMQAFENHPFLKDFDARMKRNPYLIYLRKNRSRVEGVNMNLNGENPGGNFYQKHFSRLYMEECSFETSEVYNKRRDSISEMGCLYRFAGMMNFTKHMPAGQIFSNLDNKKYVVNFPQYVNPLWTETEKEKAIKEYGGENSIGFRLYVKGEMVEDGVSVMDMERIRRNYNYEKKIKHFEITKENLPLFETNLILERPKNANTIYVCADIGETAPTEIVIISKVNDCFHYIYNITAYNLTDKEQFKVFRFIAEKMEANFIGLDVTDGQGRAIFRSLEEVFGRKNLVWVHFGEKIVIDVEKDDKGNILFKNGEPVYKEEYVEAWSIKRLKDLLYLEGGFQLPPDHKLDKQLNGVIAVQSGTRLTFKCIEKEDHLLAAFRVFSISEWFNSFVNAPRIIKKAFCKTII